MWDYLVKKIRPSNAPRSPERTAAARGPVDSQGVQAADQHPAASSAGDRPRRLLCPACSGAMRVEKVGPVEIDRCSACGGIFLDRGELEELTHEELPASRSRPTGKGGERSVPGRDRSVLIYTPNGLRGD